MCYLQFDEVHWRGLWVAKAVKIFALRSLWESNNENENFMLMINCSRSWGIDLFILLKKWIISSIIIHLFNLEEQMRWKLQSLICTRASLLSTWLSEFWSSYHSHYLLYWHDKWSRMQINVLRPRVLITLPWDSRIYSILFSSLS